MKIGDTVRVTKIPDDLPETDRRLVGLFKSCLGKDFKVAAFDDDLIELHIGEVFNQPSDKHRIWLPKDHLKVVA